MRCGTCKVWGHLTYMWTQRSFSTLSYGSCILGNPPDPGQSTSFAMASDARPAQATTLMLQRRRQFRVCVQHIPTSTFRPSRPLRGLSYSCCSGEKGSV